MEILLIVGMVALLAGMSWLALRGVWLGRSVESSAENLASFVRTVQSVAKETESAQKIFFTETEATWIRYPGKSKSDVNPELVSGSSIEGEVVRKHVFKNDVMIKEFSISGTEVDILEEEEVGIIIDERGEAETAVVVLGKGAETSTVSIGGSLVTSSSGSLGVVDGGVVIPAEAGIQDTGDALIVQTEPLNARGWQVINVNNVDKVKEIKLRVKLDSKLPASAHVHAYVFPGWYENKKVAHGITGQQTKMGTVPNFYGTKQNKGDSPLFETELYRESTADCLAFLMQAVTLVEISGTVTNEEGKPITRKGGGPIRYIYVDCIGDFLTFSGTVSNVNGAYSANVAEGHTYEVKPRVTGDDCTVQFIPANYTYPSISEDQTNADFIGYLTYDGTSAAKLNIKVVVSGEAREGVLININHVNGVPPGFVDPSPGDTFMITNANGEAIVQWWVDHSYEIIPSKSGFVFEPSSVTIFHNRTQSNAFFSIRKTGTGTFSDDKLSLGIWTSETNVQNAAIPVNIAVFSSSPLGYYIYKNSVISMKNVMKSHAPSQNLQMYDTIFFDSGGMGINDDKMSFTSISVPVNTLNPGGKTDFATESASLKYDDATLHLNAHWEKGYVYSVLASQATHVTGSGYETIPTEHTEWLVIPTNTLPTQTKFLRIAICLYHQAGNSEQVFNLYPTVSSTRINEQMFNSKFLSSTETEMIESYIDYETDPFIVYEPWKNWVNDPFWLSHYGYALKSYIRPYGVNVLATKGPITEEQDYGNSGDPYKGFWYGPLYLDWDLILGNENIYWLVGWSSGVFELTNARWKFNQQGETHGDTALAPPSHYLLKNFAYLSYWYLFEHAVYSQELTTLPKRFQEPLNLLKSISSSYGWFKLFERPDPVVEFLPTFLYGSGGNADGTGGTGASSQGASLEESLPRESSSLSIPFLNNSLYPLWLPSLPVIFGQAKLTSSPDLYSSMYYLQERINHTMLDIGVLVSSTQTTGSKAKTTADHVFDINTMNDGSTYRNVGNFESFSTVEDTLASWWRWYQEIPWSKGQAFPKKTGIMPSNYTERIGWERPIVSQPSNYWDYFGSSLIFSEDSKKTHYNVIQVVNAPHTIFMSTAHYPLGIVQIAIKK